MVEYITLIPDNINTTQKARQNRLHIWWQILNCILLAVVKDQTMSFGVILLSLWIYLAKGPLTLPKCNDAIDSVIKVAVIDMDKRATKIHKNSWYNHKKNKDAKNSYKNHNTIIFIRLNTCLLFTRCPRLVGEAHIPYTDNGNNLRLTCDEDQQASRNRISYGPVSSNDPGSWHNYSPQYQPSWLRTYQNEEYPSIHIFMHLCVSNAIFSNCNDR